MENKESKVKLYITTAILTFMGTLSFQMSFLHTFMDPSFYSDSIMALFLLIFALGFSALVVFIEKKWIPAIAIVLLLGLWVYFNLDMIIGSMGEVGFSVSKSFGEYFGFEDVYLDIAKDKVRYAQPEIFCIVIMGLITYVYALTINHRNTVVFPILFTVLGLAAPIIIEKNPSVFVIAYGIAYIFVLIVVGSAVKIKNGNGFVVQLTAIITGLAMLISGVGVSILVPESNYSPNGTLNLLRDKFSNLIWNVSNNFQGVINKPGAMGGGMLGHLSELEFSGEPVLKVTLPAADENVYIKGFVGQNYDSKSWSAAKVQARSIFDEMTDANYTQHGLVSKYLKIKERTEGIDAGFLGYMKIEKIAGIHLYNYSPLYPVVTSEIADSGDGGLEKLEFGTWIQYYSVPYSEFFASKADISAVMTDKKYLSYSELYENYVYQYYLDVNTPVKEQLENQWGSYDIETGEDRYKLALDIQEYLDDNYEYSLSPGKTPEGKDFVEYFLNESKQGYCTYFATAAVMMFRSAGVPARYVEGYMFSTDDGKAAKGNKDIVFFGETGTVNDTLVTVEVLDSCAHAWVEYYVDGIGWIDFEVTGGNSLMNEELMPDIPEETTPEETTPEETTPEETEPDTTKESESETKENDTTTATQNETTSAEGTTSQIEETTATVESNTKTDIKRLIKTLKLIGYIFAIIIPITTIIVCLRYRRKKAKMDIEQLYGYSGDDRGRVVILEEYERFEKLMKHSGYSKESHLSEMEYGKYLGKECPYVGMNEAMTITSLYERVVFSNQGLTEEEIIQIRIIIEKIRERIYQSKGIFGKFVFVYVLNF